MARAVTLNGRYYEVVAKPANDRRTQIDTVRNRDCIISPMIES